MWYVVFACKNLRDGRERATLFRYCANDADYQQALDDLDAAGLLYSHTIRLEV